MATSTELYTATGSLTPVAPFDFPRSLSFIEEFVPTRGEQATTLYELTKAVFVHGEVMAFRLASIGTTDAPALTYTLFAQIPITDALRQAALDRIRFFLSLDEDLKPFYQLAHDDADFMGVVQDLYGLHQVKFITPFENACWAILTQRNPIQVAQHAKQRITETYGGKIEVDGTTYCAFPDVAHLATCSEDDLMVVVRNEQKVGYLLNVIRAFNGIDEMFLRTGSFQEVKQFLQSIRGFGKWSTLFVLVRGLGRVEEVDFDNKELQKAASHLYGRGHMLSKDAIEQLSKRYAGYTGYWMYYLRAWA